MFDERCYESNNNYAYYADKNDTKGMYREAKMVNFVPTYDPWCLNCGYKDCNLRCSKCRSVYFCSVDCQRNANPTHRKHCGRDLFTVCMKCGKKVTEECLSCDKCPVKFCSDECKDLIEIHKDVDCDYFSKTFM